MNLKRRQIHMLGAAGLWVCCVSTGCSLEDEVRGDDLAFTSDGSEGDGFDFEDVDQTVGCDMSGRWIAEAETVNEALGLKAITHNWLYFEIDDTGDEIEVVRGWDCGFVVGGVTSVELVTSARVALSQTNRQEGGIDEHSDPPVIVEPRRGTFRPDPDDATQCEFEMERWWMYRGVGPEFLPPRENFTTWDIADAEQAAPMPTAEDISGHWDIDEDGEPGITFEVTVPVTGRRYAAQRQWNRFGPATVPVDSNEFHVTATFNSQEVIFDATNSLLLLGGDALQDGHSVKFKRIGETAPTDPDEFIDFCLTRVQSVFEAEREQ